MKTCVIIGDPVAHSLSPAMHNAAYRALGIENAFRFEARAVQAAQLQHAVQELRNAHIQGITVTIPHKETILTYLDTIEETAEQIGAANTVTCKNGRLQGHNTDWLGIVHALESQTSLQNKHVAILGAGGTARAAAYGLLRAKAHVTIFNRTLAKAKQLANEFTCTAAALETYPCNSSFDIVINTTSLGMQPHVDISPVAAAHWTSAQIAMDAVYAPLETKFLQEAKQAGATTIPGSEMLLQQAIPQFELYTGQQAPVEAMREALESKLSDGC